MNNAGNVLFYYSPGQSETESKQVLMASFLSAIQHFSQAMEHGACFSFDLPKRKIVVRSAEKFSISYVFLVDPESKLAHKPKRMEEALNKIQDAFEERYNEKLVLSWDGNANTFNDFRNLFEKNNPKKLREFFEA